MCTAIQLTSTLPATLQNALDGQNIEALCQELIARPITRLNLDRVIITENNRRMVTSAKYIASLFEVQEMERGFVEQVVTPILNARDRFSQGQVLLAERFSRAVAFKHLITVPQRPNHTLDLVAYQQASDAMHQLDNASLYKIHRELWSSLSLPNNSCSLLLLEPLNSPHPLWSFESLCDGLLASKQTLSELAFPFALSKEQLNKLCFILRGKEIGTLCLSFCEAIFLIDLDVLVHLCNNATISKLVFCDLPHELRTISNQIPARTSVEFTMSQLLGPREPLNERHI